MPPPAEEAHRAGPEALGDLDAPSGGLLIPWRTTRARGWLDARAVVAFALLGLGGLRSLGAALFHRCR